MPHDSYKKNSCKKKSVKEGGYKIYLIKCPNSVGPKVPKQGEGQIYLGRCLKFLGFHYGRHPNEIQLDDEDEIL